MTKKTAVFPLSIIIAALGIAVLLVLSRPEAEQVVVEKKPLLVDLLEVSKHDIAITLKAQGTVTPRTETTLISEVAGKVINVAPTFLVGGFFNKNDVLLRIDDRNYQAQLKRAEAEVARARSALAQEQGRGHVALQDWNRRGNTTSVNEEAKALALREPQLLEAQANLASALADLKSAQDDLDRTIIKAPYDGVIRQKHADIGQFINSGTPVAVSFAVDLAEVRLPIPESKLDYIQLPENFGGQLPAQTETRSRVVLSQQIDDQRYEWQAVLARTEAVLDERSRALFVVARMNDPYGIHRQSTDKDFIPLRIGSFVDAKIEGRVFHGLIELPRHVLRAGNKVWVVDDKLQLQEREVKILRSDGDTLYIREGLENGERVCITSLGAVLPGTTVRINKQIKQEQNNPAITRTTDDSSIMSSSVRTVLP